jgi:hypothetical protein
VGQGARAGVRIGVKVRTRARARIRVRVRVRVRARARVRIRVRVRVKAKDIGLGLRQHCPTDLAISMASSILDTSRSFSCLSSPIRCACRIDHSEP